MVTIITEMRFSVLTATYNRAHTLHRVYESLLAQTFHDFEWIIMDDGSTDTTRELVSTWKPWFVIKHFWKPNGGKHTAVNVGARLAEGELTVILDSDDGCTPNALERFDFHWRQLSHPQRFAVLCSTCCTPEGSLVPRSFPAEQIDAYTFADIFRYLGGGELWPAIRTDVLREFPYPEGEPFPLEALVWNRIARRYAFHFFNEPLRILYSTPGSLSQRGKELLIASPNATRAYFRELFLSPAPAGVRLMAAANFCRFAALSAWKSRHSQSVSVLEKNGSNRAANEHSVLKD